MLYADQCDIGRRDHRAMLMLTPRRVGFETGQQCPLRRPGPGSRCSAV